MRSTQSTPLRASDRVVIDARNLKKSSKEKKESIIIIIIITIMKK